MLCHIILMITRKTLFLVFRCICIPAEHVLKLLCISSCINLEVIAQIFMLFNIGQFYKNK